MSALRAGCGRKGGGLGLRRRRDDDIIDDGTDAGNRASVIAGEGAGSGIGGGSAERDHAVDDGDLNALAGEGAFGMKSGLNSGGDLRIGGRGNLRGLTVTGCEGEQGEESEDRESAKLHSVFLRAHAARSRVYRGEGRFWEGRAAREGGWQPGSGAGHQTDQGADAGTEVRLWMSRIDQTKTGMVVICTREGFPVPYIVRRIQLIPKEISVCRRKDSRADLAGFSQV